MIHQMMPQASHIGSAEVGREFYGHEGPLCCDSHRASSPQSFQAPRVLGMNGMSTWHGRSKMGSRTREVRYSDAIK